jgi:putative transposase
MKAIDQKYLATPLYGSLRMTVCPNQQGHQDYRKRVQRLMRTIGFAAIYRRPRTNRPTPEDKVCPYVINEIKITRPNQVSGADITC